MKYDEEDVSFNNEKEAKDLLKVSRSRIDEIDNELLDLITQRTSLAKNIALAKDYLGMPIYDKSREDEGHEKIRKFSDENGRRVVQRLSDGKDRKRGHRTVSTDPEPLRHGQDLCGNE